ncbi:MAG: NBPF family protein [Deltaproteobacteria bacterium]|nr:NBPF family protein [Deltaproteobacteria bacterium]
MAPGLRGTGSAAGLVSGNYQLNWDQTVDKTDQETRDVRKLRQAVEIKSKGTTSPVITNEVTFKVEQEVNSDSPDVVRLLPTIDLGFKGSYWEAKAGLKRTDENSDEPGKSPKTTDAIFFEWFYLPPKSVPDLKGKYTLDIEKESGTTDTEKHGVTLSSVYNPNGWLNVRGDYNRNRLHDKLKADSDTEDEKVGGSIGLRHVLYDKIKMDTTYTVDVTRGATLKSDGTGSVAANDKNDQVHTWKNLVTFRPFRDTSIDGSYDIDLKQNIAKGEHTQTTNSKATVAQKIGTPFDLRGEFLRVVTEARHTVDDNEKTEETWTADFKARFSKIVDLSFRYQKKDTVEDHLDDTKDTTSGTLNRNVTWTGDLAPFWKASASFDMTDTLVKDVKTIVDTKFSMKTTFDFKAVSLTLDPSYDITFKDDLLKPEYTAIRDFKFKVAYKVFSTRTFEGKFDHTYGRKVDTGARNIQRTDSTNGNLTWKDGVPGWTAAFDLTRQATDTSQDDLAADITSTFGFKADYKYEWLSLGTSYKYDKRSLTDNSENFDAKLGWAAPKWDTTLIYTFKKTFSTVLNEGYTISLTFKYNL